MVLSVEMLPAERGDALLVEYGPGDAVTNRVLVDGGPVNSDQYRHLQERIAQIPRAVNGLRYFDLLIITHVDADHIEGVIRLLQDPDLRCVFDDIWFNGWKHLAQVDEETRLAVLGGKHGEFLGALLDFQGRPWNQLARGGPIFIPDQSEDDAAAEPAPLPTFTLRAGLRLTLLSPTVEKLQRLAGVWEEEVKAAGFQPGDAEAAMAALSGTWWAKPTLGSARITASPDKSEANGASIAVLAEYSGRAVLLAADAHDDVLTESLRRLRGERSQAAPLRIDGLKLSHHGSKKNTTRQLLEEVLADHYLVSTNGDRFNHPNSTAIKRIIDAHGPADEFALLFNYDQDNTKIWKKDELDTRFGTEAKLVLATD
jgi:hypothetical protein